MLRTTPPKKPNVNKKNAAATNTSITNRTRLKIIEKAINRRSRSRSRYESESNSESSETEPVDSAGCIDEGPIPDDLDDLLSLGILALPSYTFGNG
jgi:hypothetical protein